MKYRYEYRFNKKQKEKAWKKEHRAGGFRCSHCKRWVSIHEHMGTANRNHCPVCLWSKHVDEHKGDRRAVCHGGMRPIGLTFKNEGMGRQGEIMLVHECASCHKISINRIAGDDSNDDVLLVFEHGLMHNTLAQEGIQLLDEMDRAEVCIQLFGK